MTNRKLQAITLTALMVLSTIAIAGAGLAADIPRGGTAPTFNPGVGGGNDVVVSEQKPVVFRGEDDINLVGPNGQPVDPSNLVGVAGDAEGQPLELPIPQDQALGQYAFNGQAAQPGVTVQQPRVTDLEVLNERGADVEGSSVPEDEILLIRAEWNYEEAEDLSLEVRDENGNEITGDVLTSDEALSEQQVNELTGAYAQFPEAVGNPGQRGTGTDIEYLQGIGQFDSDQLNNTSVDAAYWAIDLSDQDAGQYTITVEGWDNLDFGPATRTTTIEVTTEADITLDLGSDEATRGQYVPFTIRGSNAGASHFVTIEDTDFRNDQVDERVFRDVENVVERGTYDTNNDGTADFAYAEVIIDEDTGLGEGQLDTTYLDDTNVDVNLYEEDQNLTDVAETFNNPEDDGQLRVVQGELTIEQPAGSYIAGQEVDVRGTAAQGIDDVALYARDQGDWELLDVNEDGELDDEDLISVDADGEWEERDVRLSQATDILAIPGRYRFGVIEAEDARTGPNGTLQPTLTTSEFSAGTSEQTSILVTEPGLGGGGNVTAAQETQPRQQPLIFRSYNGQVATEDGTVDVLGTAPGQDDVLLVMIDTRGRVATEQVTVDDDDIFEEDDIPLVTQDGRELNEGTILAATYGVGRDGVIGDGIIPGQDRADLGAFENYIQSFSGTGLTQQQVAEIIADESVNEAGSDDLYLTDQFRYTDGATNIETIRPQDANVVGINPVQPGDTMVVEGLTNRKPDDNTISVDVTDGPSAAEFPSESVDEWNFTGRWQVALEVPANAEPGLYTLEADDGDNTDIVTFQVSNETAPTEPNATETPTPTGPNETETPTEPGNQSSVTFEDQQVDGNNVTVASASLPDGGFVVIHDSGLLDGDAVGSVVGVSEYLEPGTYQNLTIQLEQDFGGQQTMFAMPHLDTNGNQTYDFVTSNGSVDGPYTANGSAVTDQASVSFEQGSPSPTPGGNASAMAPPPSSSSLAPLGLLLAGVAAVGLAARRAE